MIQHLFLHIIGRIAGYVKLIARGRCGERLYHTGCGCPDCMHRQNQQFADLMRIGEPDHGLMQARMEMPGIARCSAWAKVRDAHLKMEPACACCGKTVDEVSLQVHHKFPFHYCIALGRPDLETDHRNLITLCETTSRQESDNHHLLIGHLDDFKSSNLNVDQDVVTFKGMTAEQIKEDTRWKADESKRLKQLNDMSDDEKTAFKDLMNKTYPLA